MIKELLIGSTNPGKIAEWKDFLKETIGLISVSDLGDLPEPNETGKTFLENARIKARHYANLTKRYVMSDDGGFEVDFLNGAPGVKSRRILPGDKDGTDQELIDFILDKLKGVPESERGANLITVLAVSDPDGNIIYEDKGSFRGVVAQKPSQILISGYPFRSILYIPDLGKNYVELTPEEHEEHNHKKKMARRFVSFLLK